MNRVPLLPCVLLLAYGCGSKQQAADNSTKPPAHNFVIPVEPSKPPANNTPPPVPKGAVFLDHKFKPGEKIHYIIRATENRGTGSNVESRYDYSLTAGEKHDETWDATLQVNKLRAQISIDEWLNSFWKSSTPNSEALGALQSFITSGLAFGLAGVRYPDAPIKPGSIWQDNLDAGKMVALVTSPETKTHSEGWIRILFKFVKYGNRDGKKVAVINYSCSGTGKVPNGSLLISGKGTVEVDTSTSLPVFVKSDIATTLEMNKKKTELSMSATAHLVR